MPPHTPDFGDPGQLPVKDVPWRPALMCKTTEYRAPHETFSVNFVEDRSLRIVQKMSRDNWDAGWQPFVFGDVIVRPQDDRGPGPSVDVEVITNGEGIEVKTQWSESNQTLVVETPTRISWNDQDHLRPCIQVRITVWVPDEHDPALRNFIVSAVSLDLKIADNLVLRVDDTLSLDTVSGNIRGAADGGPPGQPQPPTDFGLNARFINVETISGDIQGWWPLYDRLHVASASGDIRIGVGPQPVLESHPLPAILEVESVSGNVDISEPINDLIEQGGSRVFGGGSDSLAVRSAVISARSSAVMCLWSSGL